MFDMSEEKRRQKQRPNARQSTGPSISKLLHTLNGNFALKSSLCQVLKVRDIIRERKNGFFFKGYERCRD